MTNKIKILAIVGSLRQESFNYQLAKMAQMYLSDKVIFEFLDYKDVPFFNQDIEYPAPASVREVREVVKGADALWFFTPEYNHSYPGVLKNLIDWLSRPISKEEAQVLKNKLAVISGVALGMSGTALAQENLFSLLHFLNVRVMNSPRLTIPNASQLLDEEGKLLLKESKAFLENQANAFVEYIENNK